MAEKGKIEESPSQSPHLHLTEVLRQLRINEWLQRPQ